MIILEFDIYNDTKILIIKRFAFINYHILFKKTIHIMAGCFNKRETRTFIQVFIYLSLGGTLFSLVSNLSGAAYFKL